MTSLYSGNYIITYILRLMRSLHLKIFCAVNIFALPGLGWWHVKYLKSANSSKFRIANLSSLASNMHVNKQLRQLCLLISDKNHRHKHWLEMAINLCAQRRSRAHVSYPSILYITILFNLHKGVKHTSSGAIGSSIPDGGVRQGLAIRRDAPAAGRAAACRCTLDTGIGPVRATPRNERGLTGALGGTHGVLEGYVTGLAVCNKRT